MTISRLRSGVATILCAVSAIAAAAPQPIERFARRPQMYGVTISADGRYVAFLSGAEDDTVLMTFDRTAGSDFKRVTGSEPNKFDIGWCRWANDNLTNSIGPLPLKRSLYAFAGSASVSDMSW